MKSFRLGARRPSDPAPEPVAARVASPAHAEQAERPDKPMRPERVMAGVGAGEAGAHQQQVPSVPVETLYAETPPLRVTPRPPFRLLRPTIATPPEPSAPISPGLPSPALSAHLPQPRHSLPAMQRDSQDEWTRQRSELIARPLPESLCGRRIVQLLTLPWVIAPSGLAATVMPPGTPPVQLAGYTEAINLLSCGATAYGDGAAGVLAVLRIEQLNRMLQRCGLSPIVPQPAPTPWAPMQARQPSAFLLEDFLGDKTQLPYAQE